MSLTILFFFRTKLFPCYVYHYSVFESYLKPVVSDPCIHLYIRGEISRDITRHLVRDHFRPSNSEFLSMKYQLCMWIHRESYSLQASMTESPGGSARVALASPEAPSQRTASATPQASPDGKPPFVCIQFTRNGTLSSSRPCLLSSYLLVLWVLL